MFENRVSRQLIEEAINAFRSGAMRSATVSTWIAVAYDIISKAQELATQGEKVEDFVKDYNSAVTSVDVASLLTIERNLLQKVKDWQLVSNDELELLKRLQHDRHRCAHPTVGNEGMLYQPTPEQVRAHIVHALDILLVQAPLQSKKALEKFEAHLLSPSFPKSEEGIRNYMKDFLKQVKDVVVIHLIKGLLAIPFGDERVKFSGKERLIALVLREIAANKRTIYDKEVPSYICNKLKEKIKDIVLLRIFTFLDISPELWKYLDASIKESIKERLKIATIKDLMDYDAFAGFTISELESILKNRFKEFNANDKLNIILKEPPRLGFVELTIEFYGESPSFVDAEKRGDVLIHLATLFDAKHIKRLLEVACKNKSYGGINQILGANKTEEILSSVFDKTKPVLDESREHWKKFVKDREDFNLIKSKLI